MATTRVEEQTRTRSRRNSQQSSVSQAQGSQEVVVELTLVRRRRVTFAEDVVDNANCRTSKVCCIAKPNKSKKNVNKYERM
ncbi:hypothetical protein EDEG_01846 [Edhazardia aedis USNM 41457]|uniref:Uncharacterized protein n=1 Tax=Edhazardia aedis (strain USNM 41457) TaxID=1003232 RepID=J9DR77_EDHAE|nr:hypothetical protein EDEG_01846 [Edhazardia aedis USNM 41457]|eukprot:EJW03847.1 hypothetical protein EDEG_01846 [Edhazardia aedis USNM 41457]